MNHLSRRGFLSALGSVATAIALSTATSDALARRPQRTHVEWIEVVLPDADRRSVRQGMLREVLQKTSRHVDWGAHPNNKLEGTVKVVEFVVERKADVVRVTCTALGKLTKGPTVRTHFSMGGHPNEQAKLEKAMLTLIAQGVITRLSSIAREQAKRAATG